MDFESEEKGQAIELLDFIRKIRNLIHQGGLCFEEDGLDKDLTYRGRTFRLYHGKPVAFVTWALLLEVANEIRELFVRVMTDPMIAGLVEVVDPFRP